MRVHGREVAAGAGRKPAAERRELERLREVAERQALLCKLRFQRRRGSHPPECEPTSSSARLRRRNQSPEVETQPRAVAIVDVPFDAADDAGSAPKGITATFASPAQSSRARMSSSVRGVAARSGAESKSPRKPRRMSR